VGRVLLNLDLGELPGEPEGLYACADLAHLACGGHAGDEASMAEGLERCRRHGTRAGAHPSYPDREGFGRRALDLAPAALSASVEEQCARLAVLARRAGLVLYSVKPHGALYHAADADRDLAEAVLEGARRALGPDPVLVGPGGGALAAAAAGRGVRFAREGFADRAMRREGGRWRLVPRSEPGALLTDPAAVAAQARAFAESGEFETLCLHGDTPGALALARAVRAALDALPQG
jgi:UPF0271 protein